MATDLFYLPVTELARLLEGRRISAVELLQALVARTRAVEGRVKAFNSRDEAGALAAAAAADARRAAGLTRPAVSRSQASQCGTGQIVL